MTSIIEKFAQVFDKSLRDYQLDGIKKIDEYLESGETRIFRQAYTGTGKSIEQMFLAFREIEKGGTVFILVPKDELVTNFTDYFKAHYKLDFIRQSWATQWNTKLVICMVPTLINRLDKIKKQPTLILVDEAHHSKASTWMKCLEAFDCPKIGFSATPKRLDGKGYEGLFDVMVPSPSYQYFIDNNYLAPFEIPDINVFTKQFRKTIGDFDLKQQEEYYSNPVIIADAIEAWQRYCNNQKTITFCASVENSKELAQKYNKTLGSEIAFHLDGTTPKQERRDILERFALPSDDPRAIQILTNFALITEGFNVPDCAVTQWLRLTASEAIFDQGNGRSNRYKPGKTQIILDHVGNLGLHGLPNRPRTYSLATEVKKKFKEPDTFKCTACAHNLSDIWQGLLNLGDSSDLPIFIECPNCGANVLTPLDTKKEGSTEKLKKEYTEDLENSKELRYLDLSRARLLNLQAIFSKARGKTPKTLLSALLLHDWVELSDFKLACEFLKVSESLAFSYYSQKLNNKKSNGKSLSSIY